MFVKTVKSQQSGVISREQTVLPISSDQWQKLKPGDRIGCLDYFVNKILFVHTQFISISITSTVFALII